MVKRSKGARINTRTKLKRGLRTRGLTPINRSLQQFDEGEKVSLALDSSVQKGMPHPRFYGKIGTVTGKQGNAWLVSITDGNKEKTIIARPEHLKRV